MIALIATFFGFISSTVPDVIKAFQDKRDKAHELEILRLQMQAAADGHAARLEEIGANADIAETTEIYKTYSTGIHWVDSLNGTVRPVIAYAFFALYTLVKLNQMHSMPWLLWTDEDQAIFCAIISFYFGRRALRK